MKKSEEKEEEEKEMNIRKSARMSFKILLVVLDFIMAIITDMIKSQPLKNIHNNFSWCESGYTPKAKTGKRRQRKKGKKEGKIKNKDSERKEKKKEKKKEREKEGQSKKEREKKEREKE